LDDIFVRVLFLQYNIYSLVQHLHSAHGSAPMIIYVCVIAGTFKKRWSGPTSRKWPNYGVKQVLT
jgi:hypothetical protein